eukprot:m.395534 g.395534  ORF g.395534 m.395534 type:complete len:181 (+) comp56394_c0_seq11:37-579(+)
MSEEATVGQLRSSLAAHISHTRLNPPAPQAEDVEESDKQAKPAKVAGGVPTVAGLNIDRELRIQQQAQKYGSTQKAASELERHVATVARKPKPEVRLSSRWQCCVLLCVSLSACIVYCVSLSGCIIYCARSATLLTGWKESELSAKLKAQQQKEADAEKKSKQPVSELEAAMAKRKGPSV